MEIGKKKINFQVALSIFFSATILIYFFYGFYTNENSAGAGPYDFELIWKNLQLLKQNTFSNLDNALYNDSRPPLAYIIHIYLNPFVQNKEDLIPFPEEEKITSQIMQKGLQEGVFLYPGGTGVYRDIICLGPAFIVEDSDIDLMVDVAENSIKYVTERY